MRNLLLRLFSHRFLAIARWDIYFLRLRIWNALTRQGSRIRRNVARLQSPLFLNLGSGPRGLEDPHWVNVDGYPDNNVQYLLDLARPLPFHAGMFDGVFCEHVMEHFSLHDGENLAREVHRILRAGGCFRIIVPDGELALRRYFETPQELVERRGHGEGTAMEIVNLYFRQRYEHQFAYDWTTMKQMLVRAGFETVNKTVFGKSDRCTPLVLDDPKYEWESLYVEATKS